MNLLIGSPSVPDSDPSLEPLSGFSPGRFLDIRAIGLGRNAAIFHAWDAHLRRPVVFKAKVTEEVWLCGCKQTKDRPFCDGTHNGL